MWSLFTVCCGTADQVLSLWDLFVQPVTSGSPLDALCILCSTTDGPFTLFQTYQTMLLVLTPPYRKRHYLFPCIYVLFRFFLFMAFFLFKRTAFLDALCFRIEVEPRCVQPLKKVFFIVYMNFRTVFMIFVSFQHFCSGWMISNTGLMSPLYFTHMYSLPLMLYLIVPFSSY